MDTHTPAIPAKVAIREIIGRAESSLSLRGTILVHRVKTWAGRSSLYIPLECLSITRSNRFNRAYLLRGLRALMLVAVLGLPAVLVPDRFALTFFAFYVMALSGGLIYFGYMAMRFLDRQPTIRFEALVRDGVVCIECWDDHRDIDRLIGRVHALQKKIDDIVPYPAQTSYQLFHMRSFRVALARAATLCILLALPIAFTVHYYGLPVLWYFLVLPWIAYPGKYITDRLRLRSQPLLFRRAVEAFEREQFAIARGLLNGLLAAYPAYLPALVLKAQVCTLLGEFPSAFRACHQLARYEPDVADTLQEEIIGIEQLQRRMDVNV